MAGLSEIIEAHKAYRATQVPPLSSTAFAYDKRGYAFLRRCGKRMATVRMRTAQPVIHELYESGVATSTINKTIGAAKQCLGWAMDMEMIKTNPIARLKHIKNERFRERDAFDLEEWRLVRAAANDRWRPLLELFVCTGCRRNELRELVWEEVDLEERALHLPRTRTKMRTARDCLLGPKMCEMLGAHPQVSKYVFPGASPDSPWGSGTINSRLKALCHEAGVDDSGITTHSLRYTAAGFINNLQPPVGIREFHLILGHKVNDAMWETYSLKKNMEMWRDASERLEDYALS
jgi:integrase